MMVGAVVGVSIPRLRVATGFPGSRPYGSRFNGRLTATLHAQLRNASPEYLNSRIRVGVGLVPTVDATEDRLALAASGVNDTAGGARLRRMGRGNGHDSTATLLRFVAQDVCELTPPLAQDRAVEPSLLADVPARLVRGTASGNGHAGYVQVLDADHAVALCDTQGGPVTEVSPDRGGPRVQASNAAEAASAPLRATLCPGERALLPPHSGGNRSQGFRQPEDFPRGQRERVGHAPVYADRGAGVDGSVALKASGDADIPATARVDHRHIAQIASEGPGGPVADTSEFRERDLSPFPAQRTESAFLCHDPETVVLPATPRLRVLFPTREEADESPIKVSERLLLRYPVDRCYPAHFCAEGGQLGALATEGHSAAVHSLVLPPEVSALLKGQVVDQPTHTDALKEQGFLLWRWVQIEAVGPEHIRFLSRSRQPRDRGNHVVGGMR